MFRLLGYTCNAPPWCVCVDEPTTSRKLPTHINVFLYKRAGVCKAGLVVQPHEALDVLEAEPVHAAHGTHER